MAKAADAMDELSGSRDELPVAAELPADEAAAATAAAAQEGSLMRLQALRSAGRPWDDRVPRRAAQHGHVAVLQWAWRHGCPWSWDAVTDSRHARVLAWAHECRSEISTQLPRLSAGEVRPQLRWSFERAVLVFHIALTKSTSILAIRTEGG